MNLIDLLKFFTFCSLDAEIKLKLICIFLIKMNIDFLIFSTIPPTLPAAFIIKSGKNLFK